MAVQEHVGEEKLFDSNRFIVTKTDVKGVITYVNDVFVDISGFQEKDLIGKPHKIIRHPDMPKCIFKLMWERLHEGHEVFAYVKNATKHGDFYWVFAHVTPSYDDDNQVVGFHSNRRVPNARALNVIKPLYEQLLKEEKRHDLPKEGMDKSYNILISALEEKGQHYDEFVLSI